MAAVAHPFFTPEDNSSLYYNDDSFVGLSQDNDDDAVMSEDNNSQCEDDDVTVASSTQQQQQQQQQIDDLFYEHLTDNEDDDEEEDDVDQDEAKEEEVDQETTNDNIDMDISATSATHKYGGLYNMGNTCYLNSALQMLNSLDHFSHELKETPLSDQTTNTNTLRDAILEIMERLNRGETVSPEEFKRIVDERTPLFIGFRQQDAHELLSTLIDLLDEDYKKKPTGVEEQKTAEPSPEEAVVESAETTESNSNTNTPDMEALIESKQEDDDDNDDATTITKEVLMEEEQSSTAAQDAQEEGDCSLEEQSEQSDYYYESATKRPRNHLRPPPPSTSSSFCQSLSELKPEGIEELLHGAPSAAKLSEDDSMLLMSPSSPSSEPPPRCKLVGGRMASSVASFMTTMDDMNDISMTPLARAATGGGDDDETMEEAAAAPSACPEETTTTTSPVDSYFRTEVRVRLTCDSCKYTRTHLENFFHLSLEIGSDSSSNNNSVTDGLRKFFSPEKREVKCEKCFCETAQQTMEITRLPRALLLHLKRFIVDVSPDYTSITYRKNQSDVAYDDKLLLAEERGGVLGEFVAEDVSMPDYYSPVSSTNTDDDDDDCSIDDDEDKEPSYQIRSVVNHIGSSANCGHYTADAARVYPDGKRAWTRFNDSYVSQISPQEAIEDSSRTAYLVMYELC